jgi:hypothetical protein
VSRVIRIVQSPRDQRTWTLELDCGHRAEVTSASKNVTRGKPKRRIHACETCLAARMAEAR